MELDLVANVAERERTLGRMIAYFRAAAGTKGIFLAGSLAAGTADAYSDIDFRVVIAPEEYAARLAERAQAAAEWGSLLFVQAPAGSVHSVAHFRPFFKVDTFYYHPNQLRPSPWYTLPTAILYDPEGLVSDLVERSQGLRFTPDAEMVERSIEFGLAAAHEVLRRANRGEIGYALAILEELRRAVIDAGDFLKERPWYGFSHLESRVDPTLLAAIQASYCLPDPEAIRRSLAGLVEGYAEQIRSLHQNFGLARELETDLECIRLVTTGGH